MRDTKVFGATHLTPEAYRYEVSGVRQLPHGIWRVTPCRSAVVSTYTRCSDSHSALLIKGGGGKAGGQRGSTPTRSSSTSIF